MANKGLAWLSGIGLGAGLMYILDPERGRRRRARLRDKGSSLLKAVRCSTRVAWRDLFHRTQGVVAELRAQFADDQGIDDTVLINRVRSEMGRVASHPHAIEVVATQGHITLRGSILADELSRVLDCVAAVRGVTGVDNQLQIHRQAGPVPSLQGQRERPRLGPPSLIARNWPPATRLFLSALGGALTIYGARRRGVAGIALSGLGATFLAQGLTAAPRGRRATEPAGRRIVALHERIQIAAPVEEVFNFWTRYENFPRFISNVLEVKDLGQNRSRWLMTGPGGAPVLLEVALTRRVRNRMLAWRSMPGAPIQVNGEVRFNPIGDQTRLDIKIAYPPVAGSASPQGAARSASPKVPIEEDLMRMKRLIEEENSPVKGAERRLRAVSAVPREATGSGERR